MSVLGNRVISHIIEYGNISDFLRNGIKEEFFFGKQRNVFKYLLEKASKGEDITSTEIEEKFTLSLEKTTKEEDTGYLCKLLKDRFVTSKIAPALEKVAKIIEEKNPQEALGILRKVTELGHLLETVPEKIHSYKDDGIERIEIYEKSKRLSGIDGLTTKWSALDKAINGWGNGILHTIVGYTSIGKCTSENSPVMNPDTGEVGTMRQALNEKWRVHTLNECTGKVEIEQPTGYMDLGKKECGRLSTNNGYVLETAWTHPYLTPDGYKQLKELKVGDRICRVSNMPVESKVSFDEMEMVILGCLLADGCLTRKTEITFSNIDEDIIEYLSIALEAVGSGLYKRPSQIGTPSFTVRNAKKVWLILKKYGVVIGKSIEKSFPNKIFSGDSLSKALFIASFWDCDGSVDKRGNITCGISSKGLLEGIRHLLLQFGIATTWRERETIGETSFEIRVLSRFNEKFIENIPLMRRKKLNFRKVKEIEIGIDWTEEKTKMFIELLNGVGISAIAFHKLLGLTPSKSWNSLFRRNDYQRKVIKKVSELTGRDFGYWIGEDVIWDTIKEIVSVGEKNCLDFECSKNHNYVSNSFVVHNSWMLSIIADDMTRKIPKDKCILFVTTEMKPIRICRRIDCIKHKIPFSGLRDGILNSDDEKFWYSETEKAMDSVVDYGDIKIVGKKLARTVGDIRMLVKEFEPMAVLVDGGYRLDAKGMGGDWGGQVVVIEQLQEGADDTNVPWLVTSQLGDSSEKGKGKTDRKINPWNVRYAKEWLINPDVVISMQQDEDLALRDEMEIGILKYRDGDGPRVSFRINWDRRVMNYDEVKESTDSSEKTEVPF